MELQWSEIKWSLFDLVNVRLIAPLICLAPPTSLSVRISQWIPPPPFPVYLYLFIFSVLFLSLPLLSCSWLILSQPNTFALMGQINYILLINPCPVCAADKLVSFSELKLGLKVALVSSGYPPTPSLSFSHFLSFPVSLSIVVFASGLDNVKQTR